MKKLQKSKKGFTLTELAIVIAVIAILIAVLVPTFISLINKANESSDSQLVKNLNTALAVDEASNGSAETMSEALEVAADYGYNVDKLTPSSSGNIVWDQASNRFLLIGSEGIVYRDGSTSESVTSNPYQLWYIVESSADLNTTSYSQYLAYDASGTTVTASNGASIDVGNNTNVTLSVSGSAATASIATTPALASKKVTAASTSTGTEFRVNSNGAKATLEISGNVTVYGTVSGNIVLKSGKLTIAENAYVPAVVVAASSTNDVYVTNTSSTTVTIVATDNNVASSLTTISSGCDTSNTTAYSTTTQSKFAGGLGTENSPYMIETAAQFIKIGDLSTDMNTAGNAYYFKLTDDIYLDDVSSSITDTYITTYFQGELDGNGKTIYALSTKSVTFIEHTRGNATITNIDISQQDGYALTLAYCANWDSSNAGIVTFSYITIKGDKITDVGNNFSSFVNYVRCTVTLSNCTNSVDIAGTSGNYFGIFLGGYAGTASETVINNITFDTCINTATVTGSHIGFLSGNANQGTFFLVDNADFSDRTTKSNGDTKKSAAYVTNCENTGKITATMYCGVFASTNGSLSSTAATNGNAKANQDANNNITDAHFKNNGTMKANGITVNVSVKDNKLSISASQDGTLTVSYCLSVSYSGVGSNYVWITLPVENNAATYVTAIYDGSATDYKYNETNYDNLINANTNSTVSSEDSYGHSYKLVANGDTYVIIIGKINKMSDATSYSLTTSNFYYVVSLTQNNEEIGTAIGYVNDLTTAAE